MESLTSSMSPPKIDVSSTLSNLCTPHIPFLRTNILTIHYIRNIRIRYSKQTKQNKTKHQHQNYQISTNSPSKLKLNRRMTTKQLLHLTPKYYAYPTHPKLFEERLEFLNSASAPTSLQRQALPPTTNSYENP